MVKAPCKMDHVGVREIPYPTRLHIMGFEPGSILEQMRRQEEQKIIVARSQLMGS